MDTLRKIGLWLCGILLGPLLMLGIASFAFMQTVGNQEYVKQTLAETAVYEAFGEQIRVQPNEEVSAKDEARINKALAAATSAKIVQQVSESTIDQLFSFLRGESRAEEFSINTTPITNKLDQELVREVKKQLDVEIKKCRKLQRSGAAVDCSELQDQKNDADALVDKAFGKDGVLADGSLTLGDIEELSGNPNNAQAPSLAESLQLIGSLYRLAQWGIILCSVLVIVCVAGVILLTIDRIRGIRRVGTILLVNGALIVVTSIVGSFLAQKSATAFDNPSESLASAIGLVGADVVVDFANYNRNIWLVVIIIGAVTVTTSWILIKKRTPKTPQKPESKPDQSVVSSKTSNR